MPETLYKKVSGRYKPVNDIYALDGLHEGNWIVQVKPGSKSISQLKKPDFTAVDSAVLEFKDILVDKVYQASQLRPLTVKLTDKEKRAWDAYKKIMGDDLPTMFGYVSIHQIVNEAIQEFQSITLKNK